jgi:hypothetical protein
MVVAVGVVVVAAVGMGAGTEVASDLRVSVCARESVLLN